MKRFKVLAALNLLALGLTLLMVWIKPNEPEPEAMTRVDLVGVIALTAFLVMSAIISCAVLTDEV